MPIYARGDEIISGTFTNFPVVISDNINQNTLSWSIKGNSSQISTPTPAAPVTPDFVGTLSGSDWTIPITNAGQTTPVYLGQTPTVRRIKKRVFNGSENWTVWVYQTAVMFYTPVVDGTEPLVVSSHFGTRKTGSMPIAGNVVYNGTSNKNMLFRMLDDTTITTVEGFKVWLAAQYANGTPVTVWYILATPETTTINEPLCKIDTYSDELISTADTQHLILSTDTTNTISFNTQLLPSEFNIQYYGRKYHEITRIPTGDGHEIKFVVDKDGNYIFRKSE